MCVCVYLSGVGSVNVVMSPVWLRSCDQLMRVMGSHTVLQPCMYILLFCFNHVPRHESYDMLGKRQTKHIDSEINIKSKESKFHNNETLQKVMSNWGFHIKLCPRCSTIEKRWMKAESCMSHWTNQTETWCQKWISGCKWPESNWWSCW